MEKLICNKNTIYLDKIMDKTNELIDNKADMDACCDYWSTGEDIRMLLSGSRLFITNTGVDPVFIATPDPLPDVIQTHMGGTELSVISYNHSVISEMYFNGDIVFYGLLKLELPQYTTTIDLRAFIDANNPNNLTTVEVHNGLIQPKFTTGDLTGLNVTLENDGEFQGFSSGGDGALFTSDLVYIERGWIKGAGGDGGDGGQPSSASIDVGRWSPRASYDGGPTYTTSISPLWCNVPLCGRHAYYDRFWKGAGGPNSGAWVMSGSPSGQEYWDTASRASGQAPIWGDQGPCHYNTSGVWCRGLNGGNGPSLEVALFDRDMTAVAGVAGNGGRGVGFRVAQNYGRTNGTPANVTGSLGGFDKNGINLAIDSNSYNGGDGGFGGTWATAGTQGTNNGGVGQAGGKAIVGVSHLLAGSTPRDGSNTIGVIL